MDSIWAKSSIGPSARCGRNQQEFPCFLRGLGSSRARPAGSPRACLIFIRRWSSFAACLRIPISKGSLFYPSIDDAAAARKIPAITSSYFGNHSIRSRDWRLISYEDGAKELYDHRTDSDEFHNLANDPAHRDTLRGLSKWLPKKAAPEFKTKPERSRVRKK